MFRGVDDAGSCEKYHHDDQDRDHCPGELDLIAAVNLCRLLLRMNIIGPIPISEQCVKQKTADNKKDAESDAEHQHGKSID